LRKSTYGQYLFKVLAEHGPAVQAPA